MRYSIWIIVPALLLTAVASTAATQRPLDEISAPAIRGDEVIPAVVVYPPYPGGPTAADMVGDTMLIGTTWYENQHNGTIGRMIARDDSGIVHFCWMNGLDSAATSRHVYYNYYDPQSGQGWPHTGYPVESSLRAGYCTMDVRGDGKAVIAFHQQTSLGEPYNTAVAVDFFPYAGAFLVYEVPTLSGLEIIWPRMQLDRNGLIRILSTENPASGIAGTPQRHFYTYGVYDTLSYWLNFPQPWEEVAWTQTIAGDLAFSPVSDKAAFAWTVCREEGYPNPDSVYTQLNNDIWLLIDEDGQDLNFDEAFNLTDFTPPDLAYLPDTLMADMDTLRAYTDLCVFIDQDDWVHVAFTTRAYFAIQQTTYWHASIIWHWSEQYPGWNEFFIIHNAFDDFWWNFVDCGAWNVKAQRPSLAQDPETGYLYCTYQVYDCDTTALSQAGYPSGEIYVSVSTDGGLNWSEGTNITQTVTPPDAPPGECLSEISPSMVKTVNDTCHIMYVLDRDAGFVVQGEGAWTRNDVVYHKVPADLIPTTPLVPQDTFLHVGVPAVEPEKPPVTARFKLKGAYPNPFNSATVIEYSLATMMTIRLSVYDLAGREVARLDEGSRQPGIHRLVFDPVGLSSGIYLCRLSAGAEMQTRKILLLK